MRSPTRQPHDDADGIRVAPNIDRPGAGARLLGIVLISSAFAVIALSAAAVWWLRHDSLPRAATEVPSLAPEPERVAVRPIRPPVQSDAVPAPPPGNAERAAGPARRAPRAERAPTTAPAPGPAAQAVGEPGQPPQDPGAARAVERDEREVEKIAQDVIQGMRAAGETKGLAAFPPPGTDPIKPGLVVPESYELPEGYIRHYQTTDDGKRLEAILMFSPDYTFVDDKGQPVAIPKDGIVPPEMAPAGLPVRMLAVPSQPHPKSSASSGQGH